jgi:hypothetical protein
MREKRPLPSILQELSSVLGDLWKALALRLAEALLLIFNVILSLTALVVVYDHAPQLLDFLRPSVNVLYELFYDCHLIYLREAPPRELIAKESISIGLIISTASLIFALLAFVAYRILKWSESGTRYVAVRFVRCLLAFLLFVPIFTYLDIFHREEIHNYAASTKTAIGATRPRLPAVLSDPLVIYVDNANTEVSFSGPVVLASFLLVTFLSGLLVHLSLLATGTIHTAGQIGKSQRERSRLFESVLGRNSENEPSIR